VVAVSLDTGVAIDDEEPRRCEFCGFVIGQHDGCPARDDGRCRP